MPMTLMKARSDTNNSISERIKKDKARPYGTDAMNEASIVNIKMATELKQVELNL